VSLVVLAQETELVAAGIEAALVELVQEMEKQRELAQELALVAPVAPLIQLMLGMRLELKQLKVLGTTSACLIVSR
jgi:hypothetical protein